jgi:predicted nucleic acid-binding protein
LEITPANSLKLTAHPAKFIVTYNRRDFMGVEKFGIKVVTPNEFLEEIGEKS